MPTLGNQFLATFRIPDLGDYLQRFSSELEKLETDQWRRERRNIETLLQYLQTINGSTSLPDQLRARAAAIIAFEAKKFLLKQTSTHKSLFYLGPLRGFIPEKSALDLFSLNYDTVVEDWCKAQSLAFTEGFDSAGRWRPELFFYGGNQVRLWKLHGSVTWIRNRSGEVNRASPAGSLREELRSRKMSSRTLETALIYPAADDKSAHGVLEVLQHEFAKRITGFRLLVSVGYRFADKHITRTVTQALHSNANLNLLICDPDAERIRERMCERPEWASLGLRVHALNSGFGTALKGPLPQAASELLRPVAPGSTNPLANVCLGDYSSIAATGQHLVLARKDRLLGGSVLKFNLARGTLETVCGGLGEPRGLTLLEDDRAIVVDTRFQGKWLGLGVVWDINLATGRKKLLVGRPAWLWYLPFALRALALALRGKRLEGLASGFLSWPTSVTAVPSSHYALISESRRIVRLDLDGRTFTSVTEPRFLNSAAVTHFTNDRFLLLEHVFSREGVLWEVRLNGQVRAVAAGLRDANGLVSLPSKNLCVIGRSSDGINWHLCKVNIDDGSVEPFGPRMPRVNAIARLDEGTVFVATVQGVFAVSTEQPLVK